MPRDNFDDLDDDLIDDTYPQPAPVQARLGDTEILLRRTVDIIATAPSVPLSSTPRIDRDEVIAPSESGPYVSRSPTSPFDAASMASRHKAGRSTPLASRIKGVVSRSGCRWYACE